MKDYRQYIYYVIYGLWMIAKVFLYILYYATWPFLISISLVFWYPVFTIVTLVSIIIFPIELIINIRASKNNKKDYSSHYLDKTFELANNYNDLLFIKPKAWISKVSYNIKRQLLAPEVKSSTDIRINVKEGVSNKEISSIDTQKLKGQSFNKDQPTLNENSSLNKENVVARQGLSERVELSEVDISVIEAQYVDWEQLNNYRHEIGKVGELIAVAYEKNRLKAHSHHNEVKHMSEIEGDGLGYDIKSVDLSGSTVYIEVKATTGEKDSSFMMSSNEMEAIKVYGDRYWLYRVYDVDFEKQSGSICTFKGQEEIEARLNFKPSNYKLYPL